MDSLAKKLINDHRNPIVKVDNPGSKLFFKSSTEEETKFIEKYQTNLENLLKHERAERRCARSLATWSSEQKLAKVTKAVKTLNNYGYKDKSGTYLYPEETLFLMETNRLEVTFNELPLSIQEGYDLLFRSSECDIVKYRVYKKLALLGYRVLRYSEFLRRLSKNAEREELSINDLLDNSRKRILDEGKDDVCSKRIKLVPENQGETSTPDASSRTSGNNELQLKHISGVFEKLRETAPREYDCNFRDNDTPDYCVFLPNNKSRCEYDFNLYICNGLIFKKLPHKTIPSIYAICSDNINFYRFGTVKLPFL